MKLTDKDFIYYVMNRLKNLKENMNLMRREQNVQKKIDKQYNI